MEENNIEISALNRFKEMREKLMNAILDGLSRQEIYQVIRNALQLKVSETQMKKLYLVTLKSLEEIVSVDPELITSIHIIWYEEIYKYFKKINHVDGMNKAMRQKERLLGINKTRSLTKINKTKNINFFKPAEYDLSRLTPEQKIRFDYLIKKATHQIEILS